MSVFGCVKPITLEQELELCETIAQGKDYIKKENPTVEEEEKASQALQASHKLVASYAPLIESIARRKYSSAGGFWGDVHDFINEAYFVALQCAFTFDPHKGRGTIRFSSYAPLAISATLDRVAMRSRSIVSVPASTMKSARKWSHVKFDLENKGIKADEKIVSKISGVDLTEMEALSILGLSSDSPIDDIFPPSVEDTIHDHYDYTVVSQALDKVLGKDSPLAKIIMGMNSEQEVMNSPFLFSTANDSKDLKVGRQDFVRVYSLLKHPAIRKALAQEIHNPSSGGTNQL